MPVYPGAQGVQRFLDWPPLSLPETRNTFDSMRFTAPLAHTSHYPRDGTNRFTAGTPNHAESGHFHSYSDGLLYVTNLVPHWFPAGSPISGVGESRIFWKNRLSLGAVDGWEIGNTK